MRTQPFRITKLHEKIVHLFTPDPPAMHGGVLMTRWKHHRQKYDGGPLLFKDEAFLQEEHDQDKAGIAKRFGIVDRPVELGSKFTGKPQGFACTTTGTYWEVLPKIQGDDLKLQRGLLKPEASPKAPPCKLPKLAGRYAKLMVSRYLNRI